MRKTRIIATLGPATDSPALLNQLVAAGMDIARLNMSHAPHDWVRRVVRDVRQAAASHNRPVGIMMDTQGPAIRTGDLAMPISLQPGETFTLTVRGEHSEEQRSVDVNYDEFVDDISVGDTVLLDNGQIHMKVLAKDGNKVKCEVLTPGTLGSRRHINLPGVKVNLPALTPKDLQDVAVGLEVGVDFIALSFVREAADIRQLREIISHAAKPPRIVAKIEDQLAVQNLAEIVQEADAVMVARGDLGIECPYEELPIIQRRVVQACLASGRPVIVATHMLESMIENPLPTRAEITDVANAVFEQADAVMLSGETTVGKYPLACVGVLDRIARRIERSGGADYHQRAALVEARPKLVKSAVVLANELHAAAILVFTMRGSMPRYAAWMRPRYSPIYAFCTEQTMANSLTMLWGVTPVVMPLNLADPEATISAALATLVSQQRLRQGDTAVVITTIATGTQMVDAVEMRVIS